MVKLWLGLGLGALALGVLGYLHQGLYLGVNWNWSQVCHHEPLVTIATCVGIALLVVTFIEKQRRQG